MEKNKSYFVVTNGGYYVGMDEKDEFPVFKSDDEAMPVLFHSYVRATVCINFMTRLGINAWTEKVKFEERV